jgi:FkbM family methyltransferase
MRLATPLLNIGKFIWERTPNRSLREFYFKLFLATVRNKQTVSTIEGMTFQLDLGEMIDVQLFLERYEPDVCVAIERYCRPGLKVLDIGANIGAHTFRLAKCVGSEGHVFAFEPTDYAYEKLRVNVRLNSFTNISTYHVALAEQNLAQQTISYRSSWRTDGECSSTNGVVDFVRLDDWSVEQGVESVDFIKIDVDGNEYPILAGGRELIERCRPIFVMEAVGPHFDNEARNPHALLARLGYPFRNTRSGVEYKGVQEMAEALPRHDNEMTQSLNVVAWAKGAKDEI